MSKFKNVLVIGAGLMGGSLTLAVSKYLPEKKLFVSDTDAKTLSRVCADTGAKPIVGKFKDILPLIDLTIVACYLPDALNFLHRYAPYFKKGSLVTDFTGVKRVFNSHDYENKRNHFEFIGGHPMCGRANGGYANADSELFLGKTFILCEDEININKEYDNKADYIEFLTALGISRVTETDPITHDKMIAYTSQLPHIISQVYRNSYLFEEADGFHADSFLDMIRVGDFNNTMWRPLFDANADYLAEVLNDFIDKIQYWRDSLAPIEDEVPIFGGSNI
jgi:prephenate dehydrogenase